MSDSTTTIMDSINTMLEKIFSSVDNNLYSVLDSFVFIDKDILKDKYFQKIIGSNSSNGILLIANSLILGFLIYFSIKYFFSHLGITESEHPVQFIFKLIIFTILMNFSYFICEQIIYIISLLSSSIRQIGEKLFSSSICFSKLIQNLNTTISFDNSSLNIFSLDGLIKSFISIGLLNLTITYAIRYVLIKVFILLSPFAFICLTSKSSTIFFKAWIKSLLSLLLEQVFISIVLTFIFSLDFSSSDIFSKFILVASIIILTKSNQYVRELLGGIGTDINLGFSNIKNLFLK